MKNIAKFLSIIAFVCVGSLTSCDTDAIGTLYEGNNDSPSLSFPSSQLIFEVVAEDNGVVKVPVYRGNTQGVDSAKVSIDEETIAGGIFSLVSDIVRFDDGQATSYAELTFGSIDKLGATDKYDVVMTIADSASVSVTGVQEVSLTVQRKLTWENIGNGVYYSELFGESWEQPVEKAKEGNLYRLPDCITLGYPIIFSLSEDGQQLTGWDPQPTGFTYDPYGMVYFEAADMTREGNTLQFPMYGLVIYNGSFAQLFNIFTETLILPE